MENKFTENKYCGYKKGVDDLKGLFAFRGSETGAFEYGTNNIAEYGSPGSRLIFAFDCEKTDAAIAEEVERRKQWNENYIKELKEQGKFEEEYCITIQWMHNPEFDGPINPPKLEPIKYEDYGTLDLW